MNVDVSPLKGKRLLQMHASFHLLSSPPEDPKAPEPEPEPYRSVEGDLYQYPTPFYHEDYRNLEAVTRNNIDNLIDENVLIPIIRESGLTGTMRWKPADVSYAELRVIGRI